MFGLGEFYALTCAMVWGVAVICYKQAGTKVPAFQLNLFKNIVGTVGFTLAILVVAGLGRSELLPSFTWRETALLCLSGALGITVADTFMLRSLQLLGAGRMAVVDCLYTPSMIVCAVLMLSDTLELSQIAGASLVILGVLVVGLQPEKDISKQDLHRGVAFGAGAMIIMAFALILVKPILDRPEVSVMHFAWLRLLASVVVALLFLLIMGRLREMMWVRKPNQPWPSLIAGALLGTTIGMGLWVAGFKHAEVTSAAILNQTSVFFILVLAAVFLNEQLTPKKCIGALLGVSGVVLATLQPF